MTRREMVFAAERDLADWAARHERGEVPGRWPYGLDALREHWPTVAAVGVPAPGGLARARSLLRATPAPIVDLGLTWDENTGRRMITAGRHRRMLSGVIWLTDRLARGDDDAATVRRLRGQLRRLDGAWVLSRAQVEPLRQFLGTDGPPVRFVKFGVDEEFFTLHPYPEAPVVVSVGGDRDRDAETLFAALARVHQARPDVELVAQTRSALTPPAGVTVVPHLTHLRLRELYRRASVVTIATRPNLHVSGMTVGMEAMATGRPVVISGTPGMADYVADGVTGLVAGVGDAEGLAERTLALLGSPADARAMGLRGRSAIESTGTTRRLSAQLVGFADAPAPVS